MKDYSPRNTLEGNLIKIENLYKSIFTEVGNTSIELTNTIVSIHHEDMSNNDAASLEISEQNNAFSISYWDGYSLAEKIDEKDIKAALKTFKRLARKLAKNLQRFS
jgi:RNA processing factor Prp31